MLLIAPICAADTDEIVAAFTALGWGGKDRAQYERYVRESADGTRSVLVARWHGAFAGYVTILWRSGCAPFAEAGIPEVSDFNVLPAFRRRKIGTELMDEAERRILERSSAIGIGVGLHHDYGAAQRLYVLRGYVPDARGITAHGRRVNWGDEAKIDDDLVLWLTKPLS